MSTPENLNGGELVDAANQAAASHEGNGSQLSLVSEGGHNPTPVDASPEGPAYPAATYSHLTGFTTRAIRQAYEGDLFIPGISPVGTPAERTRSGSHSEVIVAYQALGKAVTPAVEFASPKVHNAA